MSVDHGWTVWRPSPLGRRILRAGVWEIRTSSDRVTLVVNDQTREIELAVTEPIHVDIALLWAHVSQGSGHTVRGLRRRDAKRLLEAVDRARGGYLKVVASARPTFHAIENWSERFEREARARFRRHCWLTREFTAEWTACKPMSGVAELLAHPALPSLLEREPSTTRKAVDLWQNLESVVATRNRDFSAYEAIESREFFDHVERSPLTEDQRNAVICFDNRVQVIASAGSGKTSTMVAKAGYALHRRLVSADKILMLAFNRAAADELGQRTRVRLAAAGLDASGVTASTFHSFGLRIVGEATGKKPSVAPWVESERESIHMIEQIISDLSGSEIAFRSAWLLLSQVLHRPVPDFGDEEKGADSWDRSTRQAGFRTLNGDQVRSYGETVIADWLYTNSVRYEYERPYEHDTATSSHAQYLPDFYYPEIDVYHEHWAVDGDGNPPEEFAGYADGMRWKRDQHSRHGTDLVETTMASIWDGSLITTLTTELTSRGIVLKERTAPDSTEKQRTRSGLFKTMRTFLIHAKNNRLTDSELESRLANQAIGPSRFRNRVFLYVFLAVRREWQRRLEERNYVDFEDMLNLAADKVESGRWTSPYDLVMVDEMQDASHSRARLVRALVSGPDKHLFGVGDDWQSINRFAGSDLSVMTDFEGWFGAADVLRLERTFRCPQSLCDVSSSFVTKNPHQLAKAVRSQAQEHPPTVEAIAAETEDRIAGVIAEHLRELDREVASGAVPSHEDGRVTVEILGRYRFEEQHVPRHLDLRHVTVTFRTVHGSKGLEADYIVVPRLVDGTYGFPSAVEDDPVLALAMPSGDDFPMSEERRLFYVALTRARRSVLLVTVTGSESLFLTELIEDDAVTLRSTTGQAVSVTVCPVCRKGRMVPRTGPYGEFFGCTAFPACRSTMKSLT